MHWSEILTIILVLAILAAWVARLVYLKVKKTPFRTCECGRSHGQELVDAYHKMKKGGCCGQTHSGQHASSH